MHRNGTSASNCIYETPRPATPKKKAARSINPNYDSKTQEVATQLSSKQPGICKVCFQNHILSTGKINKETISEKISGTFISLPISETRDHFMMWTVKVHTSVRTPYKHTMRWKNSSPILSSSNKWGRAFRVTVRPIFLREKDLALLIRQEDRWAPQQLRTLRTR